MKYIVGLGNPGENFAKTKHNVGFVVLDVLAKHFSESALQEMPKFYGQMLRTHEMSFIKPSTYMNDSGKCIQTVLAYYKEILGHKDQNYRELFVIHDDLDIELGKYKIQYGTGPKVHNGLLSIYQHLHSENFWHVRIGVDGRKGDRSIPGKSYVLAPFTDVEQAIFDTMLMEVVNDLKSRLLKKV